MTNKSVRVGDIEYAVHSLREWLEERIMDISETIISGRFFSSELPGLKAKLTELQIILDKINDGRIQEIG